MDIIHRNLSVKTLEALVRDVMGGSTPPPDRQYTGQTFNIPIHTNDGSTADLSLTYLEFSRGTYANPWATTWTSKYRVKFVRSLGVTSSMSDVIALRRITSGYADPRVSWEIADYGPTTNAIINITSSMMSNMSNGLGRAVNFQNGVTPFNTFVGYGGAIQFEIDGSTVSASPGDSGVIYRVTYSGPFQDIGPIDFEDNFCNTVFSN